MVGATLLFDAGILAALGEVRGFRKPKPQGRARFLAAGDAIASGRLVGRRVVVRLGLIGIDQASV